MKNKLVTIGIILSIICTVLFLTPVHETGHALACLFLGGEVHEISLIPGSGYAGYTSMTMPNPNIIKDYIVSSAGYILTLIIGILLINLGRKSRSMPAFAAYLSGSVFIATSMGQLLYSIIASFVYMSTGSGEEIDIVGTIANYPLSEMIVVGVTTILFLIAYAAFLDAVFMGKRKFVGFYTYLTNE